jgi:hypothetical protein
VEGSGRSRWLGRSLVELVVIVAGVMIALAADRWIAGIDERAEARSYMSRLAEDLRKDTAALADRARSSEERKQTALDMLLFAETGDLPAGLEPELLLRHLALMATPGPGGADPVTETWEEMVSTGRVDLVEDVELRDALSYYYNEVERTGALMPWLLGENSNAASDVLWELQSPLQQLTAIRGRAGEAVFLPPELAAEHEPGAEQAEQLLRALTSRKDFLTAVGRLRQGWNVSHTIHFLQLERARTLLERLEEEGR